MVASEIVMTYEADHFTYDDACDLSRKVLSVSRNGQIALEMGHVRDATVAALARLVVLRRDLRRAGRDLRLSGLEGRAEAFYQIYRLERFLPCQMAESQDSPARRRSPEHDPKKPC